MTTWQIRITFSYFSIWDLKIEQITKVISGLNNMVIYLCNLLNRGHLHQKADSKFALMKASWYSYTEK